MSLMDSLENPDAAKKKRGEKRRQMWETIKSRAPDNAEFIEAVTARFGRPEHMITEFKTGEVFDSKKLDSKPVPGFIDHVKKEGV